MWSPTHVQVTVQRAKNLRTKGRGATNDAFVLIQMGKEKFQTSVKEKSTDPEWYEECDLSFQKPDSSVILIVFHRNLLGLDEFLGEVSIPVQQFENLDRPVNKWYSLGGRAGKKDGKYRGEIEVRISYVVRSFDTQSLNEFASDKKKRNSLKGIATSVGHKLQKLPSRTFSLRSEAFDPRARLAKMREKKNSTADDHYNDTDSSCVHDDDESVDDDFYASPDCRTVPMKPSRKFTSIYSSTLSLPQSAMITTSIEEKSLEDEVSEVNEDIKAEETSDSSDLSDRVSKKVKAKTGSELKMPLHGEWTQRISSRMKDLTRSEMNLFDISRNDNSNPREKRSTLESIRNTLRRHTLQLSEAPDLGLKIITSPSKNQSDLKKPSSILVKDLPNHLKDIPPEVLKQYEHMSRLDLVILAVQQQAEIEKIRDRVSDLETYLDNLLVRVMETTPKILQTPYEPLNPAFSR